jgi:hypothetical protein
VTTGTGADLSADRSPLINCHVLQLARWLADQTSVQEVHGQTAEAQILVSADWVGDVSVCSVALFVSESINRHGEKLNPFWKSSSTCEGAAPST